MTSRIWMDDFVVNLAPCKREKICLCMENTEIETLPILVVNVGWFQQLICHYWIRSKIVHPSHVGIIMKNYFLGEKIHLV